MELVQAERATQRQIRALVQAQARLAEAQAATEGQVRAQVELQRRTEQVVEALAEAQQRTERRVEQLAERARLLAPQLPAPPLPVLFGFAIHPSAREAAGRVGAIVIASGGP